jgi:hypothetical protein
LLDTRVAALEVEASGNFLVCLIDGVLDFDDIGFGYNVKRWHDLVFLDPRSAESPQDSLSGPVDELMLILTDKKPGGYRIGALRW